MGTKIKSPVGKYFKTQEEQYFCYEENGLWKNGVGFACICVNGRDITTEYCNTMAGLPKSTRKAFMKAYARTIEAIDAIVEGGK